MRKRKKTMARTDKKLIEELCDIEEGLTEWEMDFIESIAKWHDSRGCLTDSQHDKAEEILEEKG